MMTTLPSELNNWILPSHSTTFTSTLPNFEESLPIRVNRDGVKNYVKNRGTLNLGDWAIEGRRMSTSTVAEPIIPERNVFEAPPPKVKGPDAIRNYIRSRSSTPNLIGGILDAPNPHHGLRVKREGLANYEKNKHTQMKVLMENYGKLPLPAPPAPHTQGPMATNLFYTHQEGHLSSVLNNYGHVTPPPRPIPHVKGIAAEVNLQKGQGDSHLLEHNNDPRPSTPEPHVTGLQAHLNYDMGQGRIVDKLFHQYGKFPQSAPTVPKVKFDGIENFKKGQGDAMRKAISQCPPSNRHLERPQSVPL